MRTCWKPEEVEKLVKMADENYTRTQVAEELGRTFNAVAVKAKKMGIRFYNLSDSRSNRGRTWTPEDKKRLEDWWTDPDISTQNIAKRLRRTKKAVRVQAYRQGLGEREGLEYLSVSEIVKEMKVTHARVYGWISSGLRTRKVKAGRSDYCVDPDDLLEFLKAHPELYDATLISDDLFIEEPDWLIAKRQSDRHGVNMNTMLRLPFSDGDDKYIVLSFKLGYSDEYMAEHLQRSVGAIAKRRALLGLTRNRFNEYELDIIRENSRYKTVEELCAMLPLRNENTVIYMCRKLGVPYHVSKRMCEDRGLDK